MLGFPAKQFIFKEFVDLIYIMWVLGYEMWSTKREDYVRKMAINNEMKYVEEQDLRINTALNNTLVNSQKQKATEHSIILIL